MGLVPARDDDSIDIVAGLLRRVDELERWVASRGGKPATVAWGVPAGGVVSTTTSQSGIGTSFTDLTSMTVTFTAVANRRYKISWWVFAIQNTTTGTPEVILSTGASGAGTQLESAAVNSVVAGDIVLLPGMHFDTPSAGSTSYHLRAKTSTSTMTVSVGAGVRSTMLIVEDVGPA